MAAALKKSRGKAWIPPSLSVRVGRLHTESDVHTQGVLLVWTPTRVIVYSVSTSSDAVRAWGGQEKRVCEAT